MKSEIQISETVLNVLKEEGWQMYEVYKFDGQEGSYYETILEKASPADNLCFVIFSFDGTDNDFVAKIRQEALNFNPDEEAVETISDIGKDGVSPHVLDIINDAMAKQDMIFELADALERRLKEANNI